MRRILALLVLSVVLTGCASGGVGGSPATSPSTSPTYEVASSQPMAVTGGRLAAPGTVVFTVTVPAGGPACGRNLRGGVTDQTATTVWVQLLLDGDFSCPTTTTAEVGVAVPDLTGRELVVDGERSFVVSGGALTACDATFGCAGPPADHCDPVWIDLAVRGVELPPEVSRKVLGCTPDWLVLDVDAVVTGCQSVDGSPPPTGCAGSGRHVRWFLHFDTRWQVVASSPAAGCGGVHATVPTFPDALCNGLPAR